MPLDTLLRSRLRLWLFSLVPLASREFYWTIRTADGRLVYGNRTLQAGATAGVLVEAFVPVVEGELLYAGIQNVNDGTQPGAAYCEIRLFVDPMRDEDAGYKVCSGWPGVAVGPAYPAQPLWPEDGLGSPPFMYQDADPVAGAEAIVTCTGWEVVQLLAFRVALVTDATVANRNPRLISLTGGATDWAINSALLQTAGQSIAWSWLSTGSIELIDTSQAMIPALGPTVRSGGIVRTSTVGIQAGDNYTAPRITCRWQPVEV